MGLGSPSDLKINLFNALFNLVRAPGIEPGTPAPRRCSTNKLMGVS